MNRIKHFGIILFPAPFRDVYDPRDPHLHDAHGGARIPDNRILVRRPLVTTDLTLLANHHRALCSQCEFI